MLRAEISSTNSVPPLSSSRKVADIALGDFTALGERLDDLGERDDDAELKEPIELGVWRPLALRAGVGEGTNRSCDASGSGSGSGSGS